MAKPTYEELGGYLEKVIDELRQLSEHLAEVKSKAVEIRRRIRDADREIERGRRQSKSQRSKIAYQERKQEAIAAVHSNGEVKGSSSRNGAVANGERIVNRYLQANRAHARKPHDKFPKELARLADLMYTELEREDGSLPPSLIQERLSKQGLMFNVELIKIIASSHEWFVTISDSLSKEQDVAIARCGGADEE